MRTALVLLAWVIAAGAAPMIVWVGLNKLMPKIHNVGYNTVTVIYMIKDGIVAYVAGLREKTRATAPVVVNVHASDMHTW